MQLAVALGRFTDRLLDTELAAVGPATAPTRERIAAALAADASHPTITRADRGDAPPP